MLKQIMLTISLSACILIAHAGEPEIIAQKVLDNTIERVNPINENAPELPSSLFVEKGKYRYRSKTFNLSEGGLYRFYVKGWNEDQRIVYDGDAKKLLSALAWVATLGHKDNVIPIEDFEKIALKRRLSVTCSVITIFAQQELEKFGIKSRPISVTTLEPYNNYNDNHVMLEVFMPDFKRWVLYDLLTKVYFTKNDIPLSAIDFFDKVSSFDYKIISIANPSSKIDGESYEGYSFFSDEIFNNPKEWYKRIMQAIVVSDKFMTKSNSQEVKKFMQEHYPGTHYISPEEYRRLYYLYY